MRKLHRNSAIFLFFFVAVLAYVFGLYITDAISHNFTTFFSVVFGFYITAIAIIYNSKFLQTLQEIDPNFPNQRKIHTLKKYFLCSGFWAICSILSVMVYSIATVEVAVKGLDYPPYSVAIPFFHCQIDIGLLINSIIFSIAAVNVWFMILILTMMVNGMVVEARSKK